MAYKEVSVKQPLLLTILPYVSIIIFFAFWEGVVRSGIIPNTLLASPSQVFAAFIDKLSNPNPDGRHHGDARVDVHSGSLHRVCALARRGYPARFGHGLVQRG